MILQILKISVVLLILYLLLWGMIELLWEENIVDDCIHNRIKKLGENIMAFVLIGGIGGYLIICVYYIWML